jgi:hypothetical protein
VHKDVHVGCAGKITAFRRIWRSPTPPSHAPESEPEQTLGTDWAAGGAFAELLYSTYSEKYFQEWSAKYNPMGRGGFDKEWVMYDFGKPGSGAQDRQAAPTLLDAWTYDSKYDGNTVCGCCLSFALCFADSFSPESY